MANAALYLYLMCWLLTVLSCGPAPCSSCCSGVAAPLLEMAVGTSCVTLRWVLLMGAGCGRCCRCLILAKPAAVQSAHGCTRSGVEVSSVAAGRLPLCTDCPCVLAVRIYSKHLLSSCPFAPLPPCRWLPFASSFVAASFSVAIPTPSFDWFSCPTGWLC